MASRGSASKCAMATLIVPDSKDSIETIWKPTENTANATRKHDVAAEPLYFTAELELNAFLMYPTILAWLARPVKIKQAIKMSTKSMPSSHCPGVHCACSRVQSASLTLWSWEILPPQVQLSEHDCQHQTDWMCRAVRESKNFDLHWAGDQRSLILLSYCTGITFGTPVLSRNTK